MKTIIIDEILQPIVSFAETTSLSTHDEGALEFAISKVRKDLESFFGDLFEPDDSHYDDVLDDWEDEGRETLLDRLDDTEF